MTEYLNEDTIAFAENVAGWRDAIALVSQPLLDSGSISREYVDAMIDSIANGGTYIDLGFGIALAHARPEAGVLKTGLSALRVRPDVLLNDEEAHPILLFVCLAAADKEQHLETLAALGRLLSNPPAREALLAATNVTEAVTVLEAGK